MVLIQGHHFVAVKFQVKLLHVGCRILFFLGHSHSHVLTGTYMWLNEREDNCQVREQASPIGL